MQSVRVYLSLKQFQFRSMLALWIRGSFANAVIEFQREEVSRHRMQVRKEGGKEGRKESSKKKDVPSYLQSTKGTGDIPE
jgi:hypothetical protein